MIQNRFTLFVLIFLSITNGTCAQNERLSALNGRLTEFGSKIPQEKVYVHMDNTCYFLGDTIWFAAYTRSTGDDKPSTISRCLYADLYDSDGLLVERKMLEMINGQGNGYFVTNKETLHSGFYELRAYTRWQLNWGKGTVKHPDSSKGWFISKEAEKKFYTDYDKLYSRVFPIYDKMKSRDSARSIMIHTTGRYHQQDKTHRKLTLTFYPEGGNLVEGVSCRVAYEATWSDGEWAEGKLAVGNDTFPTISRGRGIFEITPANGSPKHLTFYEKSGKKITASLPKATRKAATICVEEANGQRYIHIVTTASTPTLGVTIMHEGRVKFYEELHAEIKSHDINITETNLPAGINQITVFDAEGNVWADRLFFVLNAEITASNIQISGGKSEYQPYEKISLTLQTQKNTEKPVISVAVRDKSHEDKLFDNGNIMTEMLLASEIKGFVPNPNYFFEADDKEHRQALDLLMMTQGWRRFVWRDMAVKDTWEPTEPNETMPILSGYVGHNKLWTELNEPKNSTSVWTNTWNPPYRLIDSEYNWKTDGTFWDKNGGGGKYGVNLSYNTAPTNGDRIRWHRSSARKDSLKHPVFVLAELASCENQGHILEGLSLAQSGWFRFQIPFYTGNRLLSLQTIDTCSAEYSHKKMPLQIYIHSFYPRFTHPYNYYQQNVVPCTKTKSYHSYQGAALEVSPVEAMNTAFDAGMYDIKEKGMFCAQFGTFDESGYHDFYPYSYAVKHLESNYILHSNCIPRLEGYQNLNYKTMCFAHIEKPEKEIPLAFKCNERHIVLPGFAEPAVCYQPNYSKYDLNTTNAQLPKDYRRTLYWNPQLQLINGKASITFYNNANTTQISISAEGMDKQGGVYF